MSCANNEHKHGTYTCDAVWNALANKIIINYNSFEMTIKNKKENQKLWLDDGIELKQHI